MLDDVERAKGIYGTIFDLNCFELAHMHRNGEARSEVLCHMRRLLDC